MISSNAKLNIDPGIFIEVNTYPDRTEQVDIKTQEKVLNEFLKRGLSITDNTTDYKTFEKIQKFKKPGRANNVIEMQHDSEFFLILLQHPCFFDGKEYRITINLSIHEETFRFFDDHYRLVLESARYEFDRCNDR